MSHSLQKPLTEEQIEAMRLVSDGADVKSPQLAKTLRSIERDHPDLIDIGCCRARNYRGDEQLPYFGAILTSKGREAVGVS